VNELLKNQRPIVFLFFSLLTGCNGRPTYNITVLEFLSNCDGATAVRVEHDPDPEFQTVKIEPGFEAAADRGKLHFSDDGKNITVDIGPDVACVHPLGVGLGECFSKQSHQLLSCRATLRLLAFRWPSKGRGSERPLGKEGEDTPAPRDKYDFHDGLDEPIYPFE
jgi:hypothetical protein